MSSDPSTDADSVRSDGLVAFGTLLLVIALLGVLDGRRQRTPWRRDRELAPLPKSRVGSSSAASEPPRE